MTKFKVGDVVERTGKLSFTWEGFAAADAGPYVVTSVSGGWIQINGYMGCDGYNIHPFQASNFNRVEQDDPLPPAPESVVYFNSVRDKGNDQCLTVDFDDNPMYAGTLRVSVHPRGDYENFYSVSFDPDAALQLAHDLNRMANEIKRKEKQNA